MRVRWTVEARSDLVRMLQAAPGRLRENPRLGARLAEFDPREVRRLFVGDYELRYELHGETIIVVNLWHGREDR